MKTKEQILEAVRAGKSMQCLDGRDFSRLLNFFPVEQWGEFGFELKQGEEPGPIIELDESTALKSLQGDLEFAFKKALDRRSISSSLMFKVIKLWLWVLDDDLAEWSYDNYENYGLPLCKAVALKYGFTNPIGEDSGNEYWYDYNQFDS